MNANTRIVIFGYSGDAHQIQTNLQYYLHHRCPITIFSPEDAPIKPWDILQFERVDFREGGKRCYIGADAIERQKIHLQMMLEYPEQFFFANDADSMCLDPELPAYLYKEPDVLWSNEIVDPHPRPAGYELPRLALHPPWFLSRSTIKRLLAAAPCVTPDTTTPVIDHWLLQLAKFIGVQHKDFHNGATSFPTENDEFHFGVMSGKVRYSGTVMVHTVKSARVATRLSEDRAFYLNNYVG